MLPFQAVWPRPWQLAMSLVLGVLASAGQSDESSWPTGSPRIAYLAPFFYGQLLWVTGLGFLVFGNLPDRWTLIGAGIIIASGIYTAHRERVRSRMAHLIAAKVAKPQPVV